MGSMYRGFNRTDRIPSHTVSSSIPTKYQRVVITDKEKRGFSSQAKRFPSQVCLNENPGPGSYDCIYSAEVRSPSFSKKGTTGFVASKAARPPSNTQRGTPGPNVYNLQSSFSDKCDFNVGVSRVFRLPVAVQRDGPKHKTPAPNQYDVSCGSRQRFPSVGTSAFLSKTGRDSFYPNKNVPSPCHYEVNWDVIQHSSKAVLSPFKSKTPRIPAPADSRVPGPGAYNPHQTPAPVKRTILPRRYSLAISAPALIVPKDPPLPGPGQYDIRDYNSQSKHHMPTAAFASRTKRIPPNSRADMRPGPADSRVPGPGAYNPHQTPAPVKRTILPRRYSLAISAPALIVPKDPPLPGPGQYDIRDYNSQSKHHMPTAAFASRTKRIPPNSRADMRPGPGFYDPQILPKQSFFYNVSRVWIPV